MKKKSPLNLWPWALGLILFVAVSCTFGTESAEPRRQTVDTVAVQEFNVNDSMNKIIVRMAFENPKSFKHDKGEVVTDGGPVTYESYMCKIADSTYFSIVPDNSMDAFHGFYVTSPNIERLQKVSEQLDKLGIRYNVDKEDNGEWILAWYKRPWYPGRLS